MVWVGLDQLALFGSVLIIGGFALLTYAEFRHQPKAATVNSNGNHGNAVTSHESLITSSDVPSDSPHHPRYAVESTNLIS
jgi:hypothetical protein